MACSKVLNYCTQQSQYKKGIMPDTIIECRSIMIIVVLAACLALAVPDLDDLISLIGAVASSSLALIFPSILSILVFWKVRRNVRWLGCLPWPVWVTKDVLICLLGIIGTAFGTYAAMHSIVKYFQTDHLQTNACQITYFPH